MEHQGQLHPFLGHFRYHSDPWESAYGRPLRLYNQHFGNGLVEEDLPPLDTWAMMHPRPRRVCPHRESAISQINCTEDEFQVKVDVHQFRPSELSVKVVENYVVVEGQHDDREDAHGYITRHFKRRYRLPDNAKEDQLRVDLSSDGILEIFAPRMVEAHHDPNAAKAFPIHQTGKPASVSGGMRGSNKRGPSFPQLECIIANINMYYVTAWMDIQY